MEFEARVKDVIAQLARQILIAGPWESRSAVVPLTDDPSNRAAQGPVRPDAIVTAADQLRANTLPVLGLEEWDKLGIIERATDSDARLCSAVSDKLYELAEAIEQDPARVETLAAEIQTRIDNMRAELERLETYKKRTTQAARAGDEVSSRALEILSGYGWERLAEAMLDEQMASSEVSQYYERSAATEQVPPSNAPRPASHRRVDVILADLDALVGLVGVKEEVRSLLNLLRVNRERESFGLRGASVSLHVVFAGPPGTGKTTVARLYGELLGTLGLLGQGHLKEVARQDLVAEYVGQTALKTNAAIDDALEGVLFIDEAYSLAPPDARQDFGREAIEVLLKRMEDDRDHLAVIAAGYTHEMAHFIESNPGLESRFTQTIEFPSYSPEELLTIFHRQAAAQGLQADTNAHEAAWQHIYRAWQARDDHFGNARYVRRLLEFTVRRQANRLAASAAPSRSELIRLTGSDVPLYVARARPGGEPALGGDDGEIPGPPVMPSAS